MSKVSVVTGANKGIGLGIVKGLCNQVRGTVILTARDEERGRAAVKDLKQRGLHTVFEQLDITSPQSIGSFSETIAAKYGGIDILCNNAGIAFNTGKVAFEERARETCLTNFVGTKNVTEALLPHMNKNGRICQVASLAGSPNANFPGKENSLRARILDPALTEEGLMAIYEEYIASTEQNDYKLFKKLSTKYPMSKCLLIAHTRLFAQKIADDSRKLLVNACCPGYVATDMTDNKGTLNINQGAATPLHVCQLPPGASNGGMFSQAKLFDWENDKFFQ